MYTAKEGDASPSGGRQMVGVDAAGNVVDPIIDQFATVHHYERIPDAPPVPTTFAAAAPAVHTDDGYLTDPHMG